MIVEPMTEWEKQQNWHDILEALIDLGEKYDITGGDLDTLEFLMDQVID